jgi:putative oxidoreductase
VILRALLGMVTPPMATERISLGLLALRVFVGVAFWFHGLGKTEELTAFAVEFQIPLPLAAAAAYTQVIGALLLIAGLCTPAAALGLGSTMAVAMTLLIARGERFVDPGGHSWEASGFYLIATAALLVAGPGRWSLDALFWARVGRIREQLSTC